MPVFTPPTVVELPAVVVEGGGGQAVTPLMRRMFHWYTPKGPVGQTVIWNQDDTFTTKQYPTDEELAAAQDFWLGGHVYQVSDATAAALTAAGYGANLS